MYANIRISKSSVLFGTGPIFYYFGFSYLYFTITTFHYNIYYVTADTSNIGLWVEKRKRKRNVTYCIIPNRSTVREGRGLRCACIVLQILQGALTQGITVPRWCTFARWLHVPLGLIKFADIEVLSYWLVLYQSGSLPCIVQSVFQVGCNYHDAVLPDKRGLRFY